MARITIEQIQEELAKDNWKLLSTSYKNLQEELIFECNNGHRVYSSWGKIRSSRICPTCKANIYNNFSSKIIPKQKDVKRILALDQATYITGYSIFDEQELVHAGVFETNASSEIERLTEVKNWLINMIQNWKPDIIALEGIQYQQQIGVTTFETLARLQGVLQVTAYENKCETHICHTATWRAFSEIHGKTRADKKRSASMKVKQLYDCHFPIDAEEAILIGRYAAATYGKKLEIVNWE